MVIRTERDQVAGEVVDVLPSQQQAIFEGLEPRGNPAHLGFRAVRRRRGESSRESSLDIGHLWVLIEEPKEEKTHAFCSKSLMQVRRKANDGQAVSCSVRVSDPAGV